jgi:hypothetical protein
MTMLKSIPDERSGMTMRDHLVATDRQRSVGGDARIGRRVPVGATA